MSPLFEVLENGMKIQFTDDSGCVQAKYPIKDYFEIDITSAREAPEAIAIGIGLSLLHPERQNNEVQPYDR